MIFADLNFLFLFLPAFLAAYFVFPNRSYRNAVLFGFSLVFYAWGEPIYVLLMLVSVAFNFVTALLIESGRLSSKGVLAAGVALNLLLLGVFKYLDFALENVNALFGTGLKPVGLPLPIGVSFYTFQLISYIVDVYRGASRAQRSVWKLGAYLAGFPQLVAGPIVRYETIAEELENRRENLEDFVAGIRRFLVGLAKKVIIANNMGFVADSLLGDLPENYGMAGAWIALAAYSLQIYYDFSGYSDMAIGMGRMLGFHYLENFNYPYVATTVADFWRRWHMSLTSFFRDYVYIPMGGNRVSSWRWAINLLFVWALTGLWHGAKWNFVLWGAYYGILLICEKLVFGRFVKRLPHPLRHAYVIFAFMIGWALFRIEDPRSLSDFFATLAGANGLGRLATFVHTQTLQAHLLLLFIVGVLFSAPVAPACEALLLRSRPGSLSLDLWLIVLFGTSIALLVVGAYNPFIYFRF